MSAEKLDHMVFLSKNIDLKASSFRASLIRPLILPSTCPVMGCPVPHAADIDTSSAVIELDALDRVIDGLGRLALPKLSHSEARHRRSASRPRFKFVISRAVGVNQHPRSERHTSVTGVSRTNNLPALCIYYIFPTPVGQVTRP
eukprot:scaffold151398_cov38-Prasinocladus_malaysianus.AAC.1